VQAAQQEIDKINYELTRSHNQKKKLESEIVEMKDKIHEIATQN